MNWHYARAHSTLAPDSRGGRYVISRPDPLYLRLLIQARWIERIVYPLEFAPTFCLIGIEERQEKRPAKDPPSKRGGEVHVRNGAFGRVRINQKYETLPAEFGHIYGGGNSMIHIPGRA